MTTRVLTGITTTGTPHLGNYVGAIRPAIAASRDRHVESYFFLADLHALVKCDEPERVARSTLEIAASWLACGLDPERVFFYRQSDIVEIPELTWLLTCVTAKGLLNRAHAYKAATDANREKNEDPDAGVTAGLYMYPVLMSADILVFNAHQVPVGRDQVQHIEMARDIAQRFNHIFGGGESLFVLPEAQVDENVAVLPGLDGRKMSKSYDNTIPLWLPAPQLRKAVLGIVTNSLEPGQPKDPADSNIFSIYQAFASPAETDAMRKAFAEGIAWGEAKQRLFERLDAELAPMRARYDELIADPASIEETLARGAERAREKSKAFLARLRDAVGLRALAVATAPTRRPTDTPAEVQAAAIRQFRGKDDKFYFRLEYASDGSLLSRAFDDGRSAGAAIKKLSASPDALEWSVRTTDGGRFETVGSDGGEVVVCGSEWPAASDCEAEIAAVRAALAALIEQRAREAEAKKVAK